MSNFRTKAREVYEQGVEERGNFTPSGTPLNIYRWWAARSPHAPERENFCHFWRVVVFWAPLMWLVLGVERLAKKRGVQIYSLLVVLVALGWLVLTVHSVALIAFGICAGVYAATGIFAGSYLAIPQSSIGENLRFNRNWLKPVFALTLPFALTAFGVTKLVRAWRESWTENVLIGLFSIWVLFMLAMLVSAIIENGWQVVWVLLVAIGVIGLVFLVVFGLGTFFSGLRAKRKAERKAANDAAWEAYFNDEGPKPGTKPAREPGPVARFFSGALDFFVLVAQVIRVKKWKICPTVEIKTGENNAHSA